LYFPLLSKRLTILSETQACIFDLDGVLVETSEFHYLAWSRLGKEFGIEVTKEVNEQLKGVSRRSSLDVLLAIANLDLEEKTKAELAERKNTWYLEYLKDMTHEDTLPGVLPFLDELKEDGFKLAVGSSSKNAVSILNKLQIMDYFETVIDGNSVKEAKPDPEIFLRGANDLKVDPTSCVVFEDAISGVLAAKAGNFKCIGVGSADVLKEADFVISSFEEFDLGKLKSMTH